jgi:hypothetical protein
MQILSRFIVIHHEAFGNWSALGLATDDKDMLAALLWWHTHNPSRALRQPKFLSGAGLNCINNKNRGTD